jgi:aryl-alcohol dehydrogenase-like predicted oxidoreductase
MRALDDLVHAGKVLYVGASNIEAWRLARALSISAQRDLHRFEWVQNGYSLLERTAERELFPLCRDRGIGFTAFSPLAGGWLTGKYRDGGSYPSGSRMTLRPEPYLHLTNDATYQSLEAFLGEAGKRGVKPGTLAVAWVLHQPDMTAAIVGPRRPEHLDDVIAALDVKLSDGEAADLAHLFPA